HGHARIRAQAWVQLAVADVECDHARGARLEETIGETSRGGSDVEALLAGHVDVQLLERVRELLASARNEPRSGFDLELGTVVHLLAGLVVSFDSAREHERLRL